MFERDVVVVGGGLAGLVAAITAAKQGSRVSMFDSRGVGGRARSAVRDGYTLNEGAHALYRSGAAHALLSGLGIAVRGGSPDPSSFRLVWDGEIVTMPSGPMSVALTRLLSIRSRAQFAALYATARRRAERAGDVSVGEYFEAERFGVDLRRIVLALMRLGSYTARPENVALAPMLRQLAAGARGVVYVDGGWQSLVDGLTTVAATHRVDLIDRTPVTSIAAEGAGWVVTADDRSTRAAAIVIATGGPEVAARLLGSDPAMWVERAGPAQRAAVLDIGGPPARHGFLLSADEPLYLSTHAPVAALAPPGDHLVTAMRYIDPGDANDADANRRALDTHATMAGVVALPERTLERFLAAPVVAWGTQLPGVERPTGLELASRGVFAAGDWVGDHLLADAAAASGHASGLAAARHAASLAVA
jgi:phytoene dehydrogenase-like protein